MYIVEKKIRKFNRDRANKGDEVMNTAAIILSILCYDYNQVHTLSGTPNNRERHMQ